MGGGSAAGKSSVLDSGHVSVDPNHVSIDPDAIKALLPEYRAGLSSGNKNAAAEAHEESSHIAGRVLKEASDKKCNIVLDGTGNTSYDTVKRKVKGAKAKGFAVKATYVTVPTEIALDRNIKRFEKTGRLVPPEYVKHVHSKISELVPQLINDKVFDDIEVYDTSDGTSKIAAYQDGTLNISDSAKWTAFLGVSKKSADKSKSDETADLTYLMRRHLLGDQVKLSDELKSDLDGTDGVVDIPSDWQEFKD